ncbi:cation:proton antiporter [Actinotalea sp. K2]|uniref:cation:proton antiporter n=1 Tax=Actinotalea sp. K2 TaxID=2939438 RepID=UPI00201716DF|nr:cation:proton antiporter family protein [Actinotalea sp. K2]MCL3860359.1 cation:proton antiporter [Actinotalea sp. K2]
MLDSDFGQVAAILLIAATAGGLARLLRQPLIIAYIAVGILVGPAVLGLVTATEQVALLAEVGIAVLLFLVGLKLDVHLIRSTGPVALVTGLGQVVFTSVVGFVLTWALGYDVVTSIYVAVALTFSSTIIIVKLLSDKRELDELHGRIAIGFLIVQDIVVVLAMIVITATGSGGGDAVGSEVALIALRGVGFLLGVAVLARYALPWLFDRLAGSPELVVLSGLAWAVAVGAFSDWIGLSMEVGAFVAGISLASTAYREVLGARLVSLRDILILFFFIDLGTTMEFGEAAAQIGPALVLSAFVLIGNPLIVMVIMGLMGYRKRVSFLSGLAVAQISEFSLILAALALSVGHIESPAVSLVTMVGVITIGLSTYLILYSKEIYERIAPALSVFERSAPTRGQEGPQDGGAYDAIVIGGGRFGSALLSSRHAQGRLLLVDFDPNALRTWREKGVETLYGDITEPELAQALPLSQARAVVCTVPDLSVNLTLLEALRHHGFRGTVALTALSVREAEVLSGEEGVTVMRPFADAADQNLPFLFDRPDPSKED